MCRFSESDFELGWLCPFLNPNETVKSCCDCCFWSDDDMCGSTY